MPDKSDMLLHVLKRRATVFSRSPSNPAPVVTPVVTLMQYNPKVPQSPDSFNLLQTNPSPCHGETLAPPEAGKVFLVFWGRFHAAVSGTNRHIPEIILGALSEFAEHSRIMVEVLCKPTQIEERYRALWQFWFAMPRLAVLSLNARNRG